MKKIILIFALICSLGIASSCTKWLDVQPKTEIKSDVMFESEQGLQDALIGCYLLMSKNSLYGAELSITLIECLAQQYEHYYTSTSYVYSQASLYNYTLSSVQTKIDNIYAGLYNVIANVNNVIDNIDALEGSISPTSYAMTKGEAYALRAFLHFDLARLYSYGNLTERPGYMSEECLVYRTTFDKVVTPRLTVEEYFENINSDLDLAIDLLSKYDPDSNAGARPDDYEEPSTSDLFFINRDYRLNHNAALAIKMRVLMWLDSQNNKTEVLTLAEYLMSNGGLSWISDSNINSTYDYNRDLVFSTEQLFGIEIADRFDNYVTPYFKLTVSDNLNINYNSMYRSTTRLDAIFEITEDIGVSDYRYTRHYTYGDKNQIIKYWLYYNASDNTGAYCLVQPLIRTPEIYYTAIECLINKGDAASLEQAVTYLNTVRTCRGISAANNLSKTLSAGEIALELEKEWKKEMMGDGQMFFYYKRLGLTSINYYSLGMTDTQYVLPIPSSEE